MKKEAHLSLLTLFAYDVKSVLSHYGPLGILFAELLNTEQIDLYSHGKLPEETYEHIRPYIKSYYKYIDYLGYEIIVKSFDMVNIQPEHQKRIHILFNKIYFLKITYTALYENYKSLYTAKQESDRHQSPARLINITAKGKQLKIENKKHLQKLEEEMKRVFGKALRISEAVFPHLPIEFWNLNSKRANVANIYFKKVLANTLKPYLDRLKGDKSQKYHLLGLLYMYMRLIETHEEYYKNYLTKYPDEEISRAEVTSTHYINYLKDEGKNYYKTTNP